MRIISGKNRGRILKTLTGMNTRPTADRVKESLFSILFKNVEDAYVLDLFAGSGALGLECISRGAKQCVFVDSSKEAINIIKKNIELCNAMDKSEIRNTDFMAAIDKSIINKEKFDLVFVDPPYSKNIVDNVLLIIEQVLSTNGIIIAETDEKDELPDAIHNLVRYDTRKYGRTVISFFVREG
jgi:16S rRNA (guanine(966)-N(2))-methyltransferase RsmD